MWVFGGEKGRKDVLIGVTRELERDESRKGSRKGPLMDGERWENLQGRGE